MYHRDVILPLDPLLKPRQRYMGEERHKIALEEQHKAFMVIHKNTREAKKKQKDQVHKKSKDEEF